MPELERTESPRSGQLLEDLELLDKLESGPSRQRNGAERSVSFNRDVHVKRIGRGAPHVSTALVGDGENRFVTTPVRKESIKARSKEDLAQEAALVLQQADSLDCFARDPNDPRKYSTLPTPRGRRSKEPATASPAASGPARRRRSEELGATQQSPLPQPLDDSPTRPKKKALERSASDAGAGKIRQTITKLFSPKLERKRYVSRSRSDAGAAAGSSAHRKRSGSDSESSHTGRARKPLSPIIEASPQVLDPQQQPQPFHFEPKKSRQEELARSVPIRLEERPASAAGVDEVDRVDASMLHSSRYEQRGEESTIHKMIHRLSSDRSPPPQLTRTMVSPGPGFGHNNNRPFSYTRPNNDSSPPPVPQALGQADAIYAQVQLDKKKAAQRSHSDSDEGLGLERKDSSRENSPAEKENRRTDYYNNQLNDFKSAAATTRFGDFGADKPAGGGKYTSTVFVDTSSGRGRADGRDSAGHEFASKTSELSARRDLLESRIKSRLLADEMFAAKKTSLEHEIIDKPIVPSPVVPSRAAGSPKRYNMETYISETRTNSNGEKYIFEKEIHDENGKVYGYEKKITNKIPAEGYPASELAKPREGYSLETRTDKYGDKYIVETRTHGGYCSDEPLKLPDGPFRRPAKLRCDLEYEPAPPSPPSGFRGFEAARGKSKSTQRLDGLTERARLHVTRSHENLSSADYVNARELRKSPLAKRRLAELREGPNDDYDTDISQATNSQLESSSAAKYYKETRTSQSSRYLSSKARAADEYDSSPPRVRLVRSNGYSSSRYDSDTTAGRESSLQGYRREQLRHQQRIFEEDPKKPMRRSRNRLDYPDDSDASRSKSSKGRLETFEEAPPQRPPRAHHHHHHHEAKLRHARHRETRVGGDPDRGKDRLADSGIENDYRRDPHEQDSAGRREPLESEDEGFVTMQFIRQERRHTDRNMNLGQADKRRYDKYVVHYNEAGGKQPLTAKPPSGVDAKKYEKKAAKKSGTMSKVKELFRKKEKKAKEEKSKRALRPAGSGALTDDEVSMRYREYRGDQLRTARSARDLESEINEDEYRQRRRLSTPSGSPSPPRPSRLSRSTGTLTRPEQQFREHKSSSRESNHHQGQEAERKGWFKSLSRKTKSSAKPVDKKPRIPESEILTTGTEDEEASSAPERASVQKNLRFFGDTDQESISSNRDRRNKRGDDHAKVRREIASSGRHPMGIVLPPRKPSRLAESALSSGESTTGDSSQQSQNSQRSQRSVVYLHAATVGEIPGPNERRRAASREELSRPLAAHTRTVSRSVSVLAPWRPRNYREPYEINYDQQQHVNGGKPATTMRRRQRSRETLSRRAKEMPRRGKDANSKTGTINRSTLKSKDKQKVDRTVSTESLASKSRNVSSRPELSRSTSVPRDPNKSAGWFKLKSKKSRA
ncbi:uncharacterized protein LOC100679635 [Nasonia vitripennis]|uniref:Uncharacterized protein n=1 Tax=Nasonia vitripennis TaxID=7425 RepID=A0A7M7HDF8_NASVI|nr:uncharacterized protein LOC100679635 [Nasonia vitripennis]